MVVRIQQIATGFRLVTLPSREARSGLPGALISARWPVSAPGAKRHCVTITRSLSTWMDEVAFIRIAPGAAGYCALLWSLLWFLLWSLFWASMALRIASTVTVAR